MRVFAIVRLTSTIPKCGAQQIDGLQLATCVAEDGVCGRKQPCDCTANRKGHGLYAYHHPFHFDPTARHFSECKHCVILLGKSRNPHLTARQSFFSTSIINADGPRITVDRKLGLLFVKICAPMMAFTVIVWRVYMWSKTKASRRNTGQSYAGGQAV